MYDGLSLVTILRARVSCSPILGEAHERYLCSTMSDHAEPEVAVSVGLADCANF